ncbi:uncharacterized protein LOC107268426 [Cephus cinctus]|uniref:DNA-directed DNA polymerase n=1 Tax=Cephus cinctus TaxID=211228 RepID=A0AAJ7W1V8_CEPCN|nr:uncharacterized protein LOC107268426 [Cephus cinctus]
MMKTGRVTFIDSLNYFHMPLSGLPKAFGLVGSAGLKQKGVFLHLFNTPENQHYIGPLPPLEFYSPDTMPTGQRDQFLAWYNEQRSAGYVFNFRTEFIDYCRSDVAIFRQACVSFRAMFLQHGSVCPFSESTTIASACSRVFRKNFLRDEQIAILPPGGYRYCEKQSRKALLWLLSLEHRWGCTIVHAGRTREYRLPEGTPVDGYYHDADTGLRHVLQFQGCFWHGCPKCYRINRDTRLHTGESMDARFERTLAMSDKIRYLGYELTEIWECEFDRWISDPAQATLYRTLNENPLVAQPQLEPRDAFFGGRTGNTVSFYEVEGSERIHYVDVCSLYPFISKTGKFPVGHPRVYVGDDCRELTGDHNNIDSVEGLIKCVVLPPRDLYHPVLPTRMHGKLLFALCHSCAESTLQGSCPHENPEDRVFEETWVVDEVRRAVRKGYQITAINEIWQYEITQYDPTTRTGGHFASYINTFLKIKQEASGWPRECSYDESKKLYVEEYDRVEGIRLDFANIKSNLGLRVVAKLCLNFFWGKFGQCENRPKTEIVTTRQKLVSLLTCPEVEITGILPVDDEVLYVNTSSTSESVIPTAYTNVVIAAYTTA